MRNCFATVTAIVTVAAIGSLFGISGCQTSSPGARSPLGPLDASIPLPKFEDRIESWSGKTVMVITPHPDDDTFGCGGMMALLARNKNRVIVLIYTNDDKGSSDPKMTSRRLAEIRKAEEENACRILGVPSENIIWLGHPDGMLEYVPARELCKQTVRQIRKYRPDAIFSIDPGKGYEQWHKTDHRAAAFNTVDAIRAARWHLYFPDLLKKEGLGPYDVPVCYFYYSLEPNYAVDIHDVADLKTKAALAHESQFEPAISKYQPMSDQTRAALRARSRQMTPKRNGRYVEYFRRAEGEY